MTPRITNPFTLALVSGVLRLLWLRYPDFRDLIDALSVGLGVGSFAPVLHGTIGRLNGNSANGDSSSSSGGSPFRPAG